MSSITISSSIAPSSTAEAASPAINRSRYAWVGLLTVVAAVMANVLVYVIGGALVRYDQAFLPLTNASGAILFTVAPAIVAVLLYAVLLRRAANPERRFTIIAAITFVVTLIPDVTYIPTVAGVTGGQIAILVLMHVVAAVVIVSMLTCLARPQSR